MNVSSVLALHGIALNRVAVFRALQLGDMLCAVPALRALRTALPYAEIVLVGLKWARHFAERFPAYLDSFREFPGWPGLPEQPPRWNYIPTFLAAMQDEKFDLILQLHGSGTITNLLVSLMGAKRTAGFFAPGFYRPDPDLFLPYPDEGLEVHRLLRLVEFLGMPSQGDHLEFPVYETDREALKELVGAGTLQPGSYVCIHPGASVPERRWPAERFAAASRALTARGLKVVVTGTAPEADLTEQIARETGETCLDLAGQTDLGVLAALLGEARLLICNDTGVSHLAASLGTPSVVLSTGDNPLRWSPPDAKRHRVLGRSEATLPTSVMKEVEGLLKQYSVLPCPD